MDYSTKLVNELKYHDIVPQEDGSISIIDVISHSWIRFANPKEAHIYLAGIVNINLDICNRVWKQIEKAVNDVLGSEDPHKSELQKIMPKYLKQALDKTVNDRQQLGDSIQDILEEMQNSSFAMSKEEHLAELFRYTLRIANIYKVISYSKYRVILLKAYREELEENAEKISQHAGNVIGPKSNWSAGEDNVDGPYSRVDLPEEERVFEFDGPFGVADGLQNRSEEIKNQSRYNPEYDANGIWFTYEEPANMPVSWDKVEQEDYPYKVRKVLMEN